MTTSDLIIIMCGLTMLIALYLGIYHRIKTNKGIGFRFLQYLIISMGIPAFMILALTEKIDAESIGKIVFCVLAGFGIAKLGKDE